MADDKKTEAEISAEKDRVDAEKRAKEAADANAARELAEKLAEKGTGYVVAPGLSISTRRGIVDAGQPVSELDFVNGKADFADLASRKAIVKQS